MILWYRNITYYYITYYIYIYIYIHTHKDRDAVARLPECSCLPACLPVRVCPPTPIRCRGSHAVFVQEAVAPLVLMTIAGFCDFNVESQARPSGSELLKVRRVEVKRTHDSKL